MVAEHRKRKFPEELLSSTFAISSWGNGVVAIIGGILAQVVAGMHLCGRGGVYSYDPQQSVLLCLAPFRAVTTLLLF